MIDFNNINKILIVRLSSLGDILLSTPLVRSIKKKFPHVTIDYLLREEYKDVLINNPYINRLFLFKRNENGAPEELTFNKYDLIIDLQNNLRSAAFRNKIKSDNVRIFDKRTFDKLLLVKFKINNLKEAKQIPVRYAESVDGFELDKEGLDLFTGNEKATINGRDKDYIGFAPGSRHFTKSWPEDYYISLGKKLSDEGKTVVLFGGKDDMQLCEEISKSIFNSIDLSNNNNLLLTAANMKECKAIVCNDSGLMHTACAMKVPVLAFFGSTVKEFGFTPYNSKNFQPVAYQPLAEILENKTLSCRPCTHIGRENCPKKHFKCMLELSPQDAYNKLIELINS